MLNKRNACKIGGLKYPAYDPVKNRTSTIARAMACSLDPRISCSREDEEEWRHILRQPEGPLTCAYCGQPATHLDHLRPLIDGKYPTGWITEPGNLVPCCSVCNQKKGNSDWQEYMKSPLCNSDGKVDDRIECIEELLNHFNPTKQNWVEDSKFKADWDAAYKKCCDALNAAHEVLVKTYKNK